MLHERRMLLVKTRRAHRIYARICCSSEGATKDLRLARDRARDQATFILVDAGRLACGARATIDRASCIRSPKS